MGGIQTPPPDEGYVVTTRNEWPVHFHTSLHHAAADVATDPTMKSCWRVRVEVDAEIVFVPPSPYTLVSVSPA